MTARPSAKAIRQSCEAPTLWRGADAPKVVAVRAPKPERRAA